MQSSLGLMTLDSYIMAVSIYGTDLVLVEMGVHGIRNRMQVDQSPAG